MEGYGHVPKEARGTLLAIPLGSRQRLCNRAAVSTRTDATMNLGTRGALTFRLGDYCFAVRVEEAGGVLDADRLAQLPGVSNPVAGVAAFRGEMVPVVDLAEYLGIERPVSQGRGYALVLSRGPDRFG